MAGKARRNPFPYMPGDPVEVPEPADPDEAVVVEAPPPAEDDAPAKGKRK
jgi:hypothetical protein